MKNVFVLEKNSGGLTKIECRDVVVNFFFQTKNAPDFRELLESMKEGDHLVITKG